MATCNFETMHFDMPLVCGGLDYDERKQVREQEDGEEYTYEDYDADLQFEIEDCEAELERLNKDLEFFKVEMKSGYYEGWQWQVEWDNSYDYETAMDMDDKDETIYWYDYTPSELRKAIKAELKVIKNYLMRLVKDYGYLNLYKYAQFDNGEAIYKRVGE